MALCEEAFSFSYDPISGVDPAGFGRALPAKSVAGNPEDALRPIRDE